MGKNINLLGGALVGAVALLATATLPASAAPTGDTVTTFDLAASTLDVTVAAAATLTASDAGSTSITGNLGSVGVDDGRGGGLGWVASAATAGFTGENGGASTAVTYNSGTVSTTGTVTTETAGATTLDAEGGAVAVVSATEVSGVNTASWTPALTVTLPASARAGEYTGTITTSVV